MITAIRSLFSSTLGKAIALGFILLIAVLFALGDLTGNASFGGGGVSGNNVARVGDADISLGELRSKFDRAYDQARREQPELTREAFVESGGLDQVLDQLVNDTAIRLYARELGFGASRRLVDGQIADAFGGVSGKFDQATYEKYLRDNNLSEAQIRRDIETLILTQQLVQPVAAMTKVSPGLARPYAALPLEERRGQATFIPSSPFVPAADPGDAEMKKYLQQNHARFTIPERRALQYAVFDRTMATGAPVTDKEIAAVYKANPARFAASESRSFMQVIAPDQASASAIAAKVRGGTSLAAAAKAAGLAAASTGDVTLEAYTGLTNAAAAKAAFAAKRGDVLGPTQTDLGWSVAQVDKVTASPARTLAQATPEIREQLEQAKSNEAIIALYNAIQDAADSGAAITEIAETNKLKLSETPAILPSGRAPSQPAFALAPELAPMVAQAFQGADEGEVHLATLVENQKFAVYAVKSTIAAAPPPFADIRAALLGDWKLAQGQKVARNKARAIVKAVEGGKTFPAAVAAAGPNIGTAQTIGGRRGDLGRGGQPVPPELALLFSMAPNSVKTLEIPGNRGWMVLSLGEVNRPDPKSIDPQIVTAIAGQLAPAFGNELVAQMITEAKRRAGVKINKTLVEQLRNELTGKLPVSE